MTVIFAGGELSSFAMFNAIETTLTNSFNAPARCGIHVLKGGYARTNTLGGIGEVYLHCDLHIEKISTGNTVFSVLDNTGTSVFNITSDNRLYLGTTLLGTIPLITPGTFTLDIHLRSGTGTSGLVEVYINSQIIFSAVGAFTGLVNMTSLVLGVTGTDSTTTTNTVWSQVIVADEPTIGYKLATLTFDALGAQTGWVGNPSDVNEISLDTTTFISANASGLVETFTTGDLGSTYTNIRAVIISALGKYSASGPRNLDAIARIGGVNYSVPMSTLALGYTPVQTVFTVDPSTALPWTRDTVNASEFGIRSRL